MYNDNIPPSDAMSKLVQTTPSCNNMLSDKGRPAQHLQSPLTTINNIFAPGASYSDYTYHSSIPSAGLCQSTQLVLT